MVGQAVPQALVQIDTSSKMGVPHHRLSRLARVEEGWKLRVEVLPAEILEPREIAFVHQKGSGLRSSC